MPSAISGRGCFYTKSEYDLYNIIGFIQLEIKNTVPWHSVFLFFTVPVCLPARG